MAKNGSEAVSVDHMLKLYLVTIVDLIKQLDYHRFSGDLHYYL